MPAARWKGRRLRSRQGTRNGGEGASWLVPSLQCSQCAQREAGVRSWVQIAPGNVVIFECCAPADGTSAARCMNGDFGTSRFKKAAREEAIPNEGAWGEAGASHQPVFGVAACASFWQGAALARLAARRGLGRRESR